MTGVVLRFLVACTTFLLSQGQIFTNVPHCCGVSAGAQECAANVGSTASSITKIHVVFMIHLDVGYTGSMSQVCNGYFNSYFQIARDVAKATQGKFRWTEFPWIIQEFIDAAADCGRGTKRNASQIMMLEEMIKNDWLVWNANAINNFWAMSDAQMMNFSFTMRDKLNEKFLKSHGSRALKSSDIPGLPVSIVPYLVANGVEGIHIGYNEGGPLPHLPTAVLQRSIFHGSNIKARPLLFKWKHKGSGKSVVAMLERTYGQFILPNNHNEALFFSFGSDNRDIATVENVNTIWSCFQRNFPRAQIVTSTLDWYVGNLTANTNLMNSLPVITSDLNSYWDFGLATDPLKVGGFRAARRVLNKALMSNPALSNYLPYRYYMRRLMKIPEHNWGRSVWRISTAWAAACCNPNYRDPGVGLVAGKQRLTTTLSNPNSILHQLATEWNHQRKYIYPIRRPNDSPAWTAILNNVEEEISRVFPSKHSFNWNKPPVFESINYNRIYHCGDLSVSLNRSNFGINYLTSRRGHCARFRNLGVLNYFASPDSSSSSTLPAWKNTAAWSSKTGIYSLSLRSSWVIYEISPHLTRIGCHFIQHVNIVHDDATQYGPPSVVRLNTSIVGETLYFNVTWLDKPPTYFMEAMFLSFSPDLGRNVDAEIDVLGYSMNMSDVVIGSSSRFHAVWENITLFQSGRTRKLKVKLIDPTLVMFGDLNEIGGRDWDSRPSSFSPLHVCLFNNWWKDAFPQWITNGSSLRVEVTLIKGSTSECELLGSSGTKHTSPTSVSTTVLVVLFSVGICWF